MARDAARRERREPGRARGLLGRGSVIASPYLWLLLFFLVPFAIVFKISVAEVQLAIPPYTPLFAWPEGGSLELFVVGDNYRLLIEDSLYIRAYANSLKIAAISTALALLVGFPIAYAMARAPRAWQPTLVMLVILPFWTSFLIRVYAWIGILKNEGMLNGALRWIGVIDEPLIILNTNIAVYIGIVYSYLPFMVLPLYANLVRMDRSLLEAAADLGCRPAGAFWKITVPLARPGIVAGCFLVFIPAVGEFVIPDLLGGSGTLMIGRTLWTEFFSNRDWPVASAVAVILLLLLIVPIVLFQRHQQRQREREAGGLMRRGLSGVNLAALTLGFAFLYIPILLLIVYSFNESKLVTVWAGFSTKWYAAMVQNELLLDAAWMTLKVAVVSSTVALVLGTLAGFALARLGRFPGRTLFSGMVYAPLVMPEVITGLAMLLLFVALSWARGYWTVTVAHITFSMAYVAVVVQSRLLTMDRSLEEAAMDLGAPPVKTFFAVTLPIISPALVAGWLLAFTLSLDDLVIASFTSGPGSTTLPMKIYSQVRLGVTPEINAVSTVLVGIVATGVIAASLINKRAMVIREREAQAAEP